MKYSQDYIERAHKYSSAHLTLITNSELCACFHCLSIYPAKEIVEWIEEFHTAVCPYCGIDSVLPSNSGLPINEADFLKQMNEYWF